MPEVLLLSPTYRDIYGSMDIELLELGQAPLGLAYVGGYLKDRGVDVKLRDLEFDPELSTLGIEGILRKERPRVVGISSTTPQMRAALQIARACRRVDPKIQVVIGGPHASALPEETAGYSEIDAVCVGEGEDTLLELVAQGGPRRGIAGLVYRDGDGATITTEPRKVFEDINDLPLPLYEDLPVDKYGMAHRGHSMQILTGRGCPYTCSFCASVAVRGRSYRTRNADSVVAELRRWIGKYDATHFDFLEETFSTYKQRVVDLCRGIVDSGLRIDWTTSSRADRIDHEILSAMKAAGCTEIAIGVESGDEQILARAAKGVKLAEIKRAFAMIKDYGIATYGYFILGLPYETEQTLQNTIDFAIELDIDYAQFSILIPLPGTEVWHLAEEGRVIKNLAKDWGEYNFYNDPIIASEHLDGETLQRYYRQAYRRYYIRPRFIMRQFRRLLTAGGFHYYRTRGRAFLSLIKNTRKAGIAPAAVPQSLYNQQIAS